MSGGTNKRPVLRSSLEKCSLKSELIGYNSYLKAILALSSCIVRPPSLSDVFTVFSVIYLIFVVFREVAFLETKSKQLVHSTSSFTGGKFL